MANVYDVSAYQRELWRYHKMIDEGAAGAAVREGEARYAGFDGFAGEVFHRLFADTPARVEEPGQDAAVWEQLHAAIDEVPEFADLRQRTVGSDRWAGVAAAATLDTLLTTVDKPAEQVPDPSTDDNVVDALRWLLDNTEDEAEREAIQESFQVATDRQKAKREAVQQAASTMDGTQVRQAVRKAAAAAQAALDAENKLVDGWGAGQEPGASRQVRAELGAKLAKMAAKNPRLREIAEMAGRLRRIAEAQQAKKPQDGATEITGIELGNDLARLCPSSMIYAMDPDLEPIFDRGYVTRTLSQWELQDRPREKQGPIVLVVDSSGSMSGGPENWAAAVTLAFADIAVRQKRAFGVVHFGTKVRKTEVFEAGATLDPERLAEAVTYFAADGGTNFEPALNAASDIISKTGALAKADVVMITDGCANVSDGWLTKWNAERAQTGLRCFSILIGMEPKVSVNRHFSDNVVEIGDVLKDDTGMHALFGKV